MQIRKFGERHILPIIAAGVIGVLVLTVGVLFWKYSELKDTAKSAQTAGDNKAQITAIVNEVGAIYALPTDEEPTVAEIQDRTQLADQAFFAKAQNGDYILVYRQNKLALLYRQKDKKLINVGPVTLDTSTGGQNSGQVAPAQTNTSSTPKR